MNYYKIKQEAAREINEWIINKGTNWEQTQKKLLLKHGISKKQTNNIRKELEE